MIPPPPMSVTDCKSGTTFHITMDSFLASEKGSRGRITVLLESDLFEMELRLLSCDMKC